MISNSRRPSKCPLSREEENRLIELVKRGDPDAFVELYEVFREFGLTIALIRCRYKFDNDERDQIVRISVWQAAMRFDETRGVRFTTFLGFYFINNANRLLETEGRLIRIPNTVKTNSKATVDEKRRLVTSYPSGRMFISGWSRRRCES